MSSATRKTIMEMHCLIDIPLSMSRGKMQKLLRNMLENGCLPAEWEKAGMGTSGYRRYSWGNGAPQTYTLNLTKIPGDTEMGNTYWKGQSPYGMVDVVGNVSEWVSDWYSETYYQESVVENPSGPADGTKKVIRGDSWNSDVEIMSQTVLL